MSTALAALMSVSTSARADEAQTRDSAMRQGRVVYRKRFSEVDSAGKRTTDRRTREELVYARDGRFVNRIESRLAEGGDGSRVTFVKGRDFRYFERQISGGVVATFDDEGVFPRDSEPRFFIAERPSFPLGGGFSRVLDRKIAKIPSGRRVIGVMGDRTNVTVDIAANGTPLRLVRSYQGKVLNDWSYQGSLPVRPHLYLPRHSECVVTTSQGSTIYAYDVVSADFSKTPLEPALVTDWFRKGVIVDDLRVEPPVRWNYEELLKANRNRTHMTPKELLALSQQRAGYLAFAVAQKKKAAERAERVSNTALTGFLVIFGGLFATLVLGSIGVAFLRRRKDATSEKA